MQVSKLIVALTVAAGFTSASFAQGTAAPAPQAVPAAKVTTPAPATAEKKVEAPRPPSRSRPKRPSRKPPRPRVMNKNRPSTRNMKKAEAKTDVKPEAKPAAPTPVSK